MFYDFLKRNGIAMVAIMLLIIVFMAGVLCGLLIGLEEIESTEEASRATDGILLDKTPEIDNTAVVEVSSPVNMGEFELTAYCPCKTCSDEYGNQTSTGVTATEGRTVAVDPTVIPYGSALIINGVEYVAEDCGAAIKGNKIDIYFEDHEEANRFGVQTATVFLKG